MAKLDDDAESTKILDRRDVNLLADVNTNVRQAYLIMISGRQVGKQFKLVGELLWIGRHLQNEIIVDDEGVSRKHAFIERRGGTFLLRDNESTNGVFVNNNKVMQHELKEGDRIRVGSGAILKFSFQDEIEEQANEQLYASATRDGLTNAYNKKFFAEQLKRDFAYYFRHSEPMSLALFDIDFFKKLNDGYGHPAGDSVLKNLSALVQRMLRTEDIFARYGGEEFGIIFKATDGEKALLVMERIRRAVEAMEFLYEGKRMPVTISIGIATLHGQSHATAADLVKASDEFLYAAKRKGRNRTECALS
jgi:two-component system, cell cycle response regulator